MKPTDLRGILQYIPQFREKTFVLGGDGATKQKKKKEKVKEQYKSGEKRIRKERQR